LVLVNLSEEDERPVLLVAVTVMDGEAYCRRTEEAGSTCTS
jgi:hypothetical protein